MRNVVAMLHIAHADRVRRAVAEAIADGDTSQARLCEMTGINRFTLTRRLNGVSSFTITEVEAIAAALDVDMLDFFRAPTDEPTAS